MTGDETIQAALYTIDGLAKSSDVRAHNLANLNTPGFQAREVAFHEHLREALARGDVASADPPSTRAQPTMPDAAGNTVDLESELTSMMSGELLRNAMVHAFNFKTGLLRTAITGQTR